MWYDGVLMTGTCQWQWHWVRACVVGDLAGPADDGRVMRWSHAVEIRPVCPPPLPPPKRRRTHAHIQTHTLKALTPPPYPFQSTPECHLLAHNQIRSLTKAPPPPIKPRDHQCHSGSHQRHWTWADQWAVTCSRTRGTGRVSPRCGRVCAGTGGTAWWRRSCRAYIWKVSLLYRMDKIGDRQLWWDQYAGNLVFFFYLSLFCVMCDVCAMLSPKATADTWQTRQQ